MINAYEGVMDTNLVVPLGVDKCAVVFDYYFADISAAAEAHHRESIAVSEKVQDEDMAICDAVQRGLSSRASNRCTRRAAQRTELCCGTLDGGLALNDDVRPLSRSQATGRMTSRYVSK